MIYKVEFTTFSLMEDDTVGNVPQTNEVAYMDCPFEKIPETLDGDLFDEMRVSRINKVTTLSGSRCIIFD